MHKLHIELDTMEDVTDFVSITSKLPGAIVVIDGSGMRINAKSILGVLYAMEFDELWVESEEDIYTSIQKYVI